VELHLYSLICLNGVSGDKCALTVPNENKMFKDLEVTNSKVLSTISFSWLDSRGGFRRPDC
jgi:hypothetical protein